MAVRVGSAYRMPRQIARHAGRGQACTGTSRCQAAGSSAHSWLTFGANPGSRLPLQCLRQRRWRPRPRYRLRLWLGFWRRQWSRPRPGFRRRCRRLWRWFGRRPWRWWRLRDRWWLQWFGPRRFRLRGVVGRFILGHFGRARGICWHPKMIPRRMLATSRGGRERLPGRPVKGRAGRPVPARGPRARRDGGGRAGHVGKAGTVFRRDHGASITI